MQVIKKIIITMFSLLFVVTLIPQTAYAVEDIKVTPSSIMSGADKFLEGADNTVELLDAKAEKDAVDQIYFTMLGVGIVVAIVVGIILGIQFVETGAEGQAKVKEKLIPFVIGAFVVFGAFGIWRLVYNIMNGMLG